MSPASPAGGRAAARSVPAVITIAAALAIAGPVAAHPPISQPQSTVAFSCSLTASDGAVAFLEGFVEEFGAFVGMPIWADGADPEQDPPTAEVVSTELTVWTADHLSAELEIGIFDPETGEPTVTGSGTIDVSLASAGEPTPVEHSFRDGNVQFREVGMEQPLLVSATVVTDDYGTFVFTECGGVRTETVIWQTQPDAYANRSGFFGVFCELSIGEEVFAFLALSDQGAEAGYFDVGTGEQAFGGTQDGIAPSGGSGTVELFSGDGQPAGTATYDVTLTSLGVQTTVQDAMGARAKVRVEQFAVAGSLTFSAGYAFDLSACGAGRVTFQNVFTSANGPKAGGKGPANDLPEDAAVAAPGDRFQLQTGGAAEDPEAPASCAPVGHTVWYAIEGTGGLVTIDTAGSNFDTVVAVYDEAGSEVSCLDDVGEGILRSLQAALTFETEPGMTYYVQVGGFDYRFEGGATEFGRLRLAID